MSSAVFPTRQAPAGSDNSLTPFLVPESIVKVPVNRVTTQEVEAGLEYRVARSARYRYRFDLNGLDSTAVGVLRDFWIARNGSYDTFYLEDPDVRNLRLVRFDMEEIPLEQMSTQLWRASISCLSIVPAATLP